MSWQPKALDKRTHDEIFRDRILPESTFATATTQEHPRAIFLAGQPGAGKGGLAATASGELSGNAVTIDPDELRRFHPDVGKFRQDSPYEWSGRTHADASQWADELRKETVAQRKNLIFDTTLSNGVWTSELINDLKKQGYQVEVRAIATSKLESELGVDRRFTQQFDREGYGRHVPEGAREAIYGKLPVSLDVVREKTDAPIRIFDRQGSVLYDSRRDQMPPSAALETARDARLEKPAITGPLQKEWAEQQMWHRQLPEALQHNGKVDPGTRENLLRERNELGIVQSVELRAREAQAVDAIAKSENIPPGTFSGERLRQTATALALASLGDSKNEGLERIDFVLYNTDKKRLIAGEGNVENPTAKRVDIPATQEYAAEQAQAAKQSREMPGQQAVPPLAPAEPAAAHGQDDAVTKGPRSRL